MSDHAPYRVIIADDVAALRNLIKINLERSHKFEIVGEAKTGKEAIEEAAQLHPDLILLDLSMPEMDGLEALPRIVECSPESRVAVLSGFNHVRMGPVAMRMGASAYLEKGLPPQQLVDELLHVLEPQSLPEPERSGMPILSPTHVPAAPEAPQDEATPQLDTKGVVPGDIRTLLLLLEPSTRKSVMDALEGPAGRRFRVRSMDGGYEHALAAILRGEFDLIVTGPGAKRPDSENVLVQTLTAAATIPVVLLLPPDSADQADAALRLGVEDCLPEDRLDPDVLTRSMLYAFERRRGQQAREQARETAREITRIREVERLKTQFFNTAAHELGTPLTPIRLQLHMLKLARSGEPLTEAQKRSIEILDRNVERLTRLTQDLLDVARLQAGRINLQRVPTDLPGLLGEVVESFEPVAMQQKVRLELAPGPAFWLDVDSKRISQVFYNLVSNALKFTPAGGRVSIEVTLQPADVMIRVRDNGEGLTQEQIERLFQPFSQVHPDQERNRQGTGLGLYVCRGLAELHGGRIWAESKGPGHGSSFVVSLPRDAQAVPSPPPELDEPLIYKRSPAPIGAPNGSAATNGNGASLIPVTRP